MSKILRLGLLDNPANVWFVGWRHSPGCMTMVRETRETWEMRSAVVAENQSVLFVLIVVSIVEEDKEVRLYDNRFADL